MYVTIAAHEIRPGDVILAESPRYYGPDVRVTHVEHVRFGRPFTMSDVQNFTVERMSGAETRLTTVPPNKLYRVRRGD